MKNEVELCRKTFKFGNRAFFVWFIISLLFAITGVVVNVIIKINSDARYGEFALGIFEGPYWAGWGCALLGIVMAIIFFVLWKKGTKEYNTVLTNKRILMSLDENKLFDGKHHYEDNILLDHIISFSLNYFEKTNTYSLTFETVKRNYNLTTSDSEFYDKFVEILKEYK